jgi:hypothetical protein
MDVAFFARAGAAPRSQVALRLPAWAKGSPLLMQLRT